MGVRVTVDEEERYSTGLKGVRLDSFHSHNKFGRFDGRETNREDSVSLSTGDRKDISKSRSASDRVGHFKIKNGDNIFSKSKTSSSDRSRRKSDKGLVYFGFRDRGDESRSESVTKSTSFSASSTTNRRVNNNNKFPFKQKGVSTDSKEQEVKEKGPCDGTKCKKLFQMPVPPSCECMCPGPANRTCSPEKVFDDNLCECLCREINFDCPGNSNFNFDVCVS